MYDPEFRWDGTDYFGASLLALSKLGREKGYTLVGCDSMGVNSFFVDDELIPGRFVVRVVEELYAPVGPYMECFPRRSVATGRRSRS